MGIAESKSRQSLTVFPNPAHDFIYIDYGDISQASTLRIYNSKGTLVKEEDIQSKDQPINIKDLRNGMYFIHLLIEKKKISGIFV